MNSAILLLSFTVATVLCGCASTSPATGDLVCVCPLNELSAPDFAESISLANRGDLSAMRKIALHYADIADRDQYVIWSIRLADAGDRDAQEAMVCFHWRLDRKNGTTAAQDMASKWSVPLGC